MADRDDVGMSRRSLIAAGAGAALSMMAPGRFSLAQTPRRWQMQLNWLETGDFSTLFAAELKGYDREFGLQFAYLPGGPQIDAIQLVAGGSSPVGMIAQPLQVIGARDAGIPIKMFGVCFQGSPIGIISKADKPIRTIQDLPGKRIGLQAGARSTFALMMAAARINPDSVTQVPVGVDPTPLIAGQVDGYWGSAVNQAITLRMQGVPNVILSTSAAGLPGYWQVYFTTDKSLAENEDSLVRMLRAAIKGAQYFKDNPVEVADHIVKRSPQLNLNPEQVREQCRSLAAMSEGGMTRTKGLGWYDPADLEKTIDLMRSLDQIKTRVNVNDVHTFSILEKAYGGRTMI